LLRHYSEAGDVTTGSGDADGAGTGGGGMSTNVEETEETLPDGTVVKRRVVTTTQQQLTTERVVLEQPQDYDNDDWNTENRGVDDDQPPVFDYSYTGLYSALTDFTAINN